MKFLLQDAERIVCGGVDESVDLLKYLELYHAIEFQKLSAETLRNMFLVFVKFYKLHQNYQSQTMLVLQKCVANMDVQEANKLL